MAMNERPQVSELSDGGKTFEHTFEKFFLKAYIPANKIEGKVNNYTFRQPLLLVLEEQKMEMAEAVAFAENSGLAKVAAEVDGSVFFIYPTCDGGWKNADISLYQEIIANVKMHPEYNDNIVEMNNFFTRQFEGYFLRGAIFRADICSFGESADYAAKNLLKKIDGQYLWGPGEITPAVVSMENLSVMPEIERKDIAVISSGNSSEINAAFEKAGCENLLIKDKADYYADFKAFVRNFKMWCGHIEMEPDFEKLGMVEESGIVEVKTSPENKFVKTATHKAGYFAYYNKGLFDKGPVPLMMGHHGGGDTAMFLTFVSGWWEIAHKYNFLYVAIDDHLSFPASEIIQIIEGVKKRYNVDESRIYATGFSMGSGKTWDLYCEYPDLFAGFAPASALFPIKENVWGKSLSDDINFDTPKPIFYSGGECSPLPELPGQNETCLDRIQYMAGVNKLKKADAIKALKFSEKENWDEKYYGVKADRVEVVHNVSRNSDLTIRYFESEDGVTRTALASVGGQEHECRQHTNEEAWKFISRFTK
ncbi:MAG: hypothetical protein MJ185_10930 [Treponema sp.]|nr:hypothetical protein [Treponema sp.]